nr:MAG TPA: hypothetical protein [Caudoviricetes sp.]DAY39031.1 MAG TPA: hypothetical protein [Caudoviricetes sp.]
MIKQPHNEHPGLPINLWNNTLGGNLKNLILEEFLGHFLHNSRRFLYHSG